MHLYLLIALGSALGGTARFALSGLVGRYFGEVLPWGTLTVNVIGCFSIGFFSTLTEPGGRVMAGSDLRQFFMTGVCGGFTTFSSVSLQTLSLARDGEWFHAGANAVGSLVLCLFFVWLGHAAAVFINTLKGP